MFVIRKQTCVRPGHRVAIVVPALAAGEMFDVIVLPRAACAVTEQWIVAFLDRLGLGPRTFPT
jgi:hypothetical protein